MVRVRSTRSGVVHATLEQSGHRYATRCGLHVRLYPFGGYVALVGTPDSNTGEKDDVSCRACLREIERADAARGGARAESAQP